MSPEVIFALILFIITYVLMFTIQKIRAYVSVISALIFVAVGSSGIFPGFSYTPMDAIKEIDWNVILMICGTMGTVFLFIESLMPNLLSDIIVSKVGSVRVMVVVMSLFAGFISAFVDNVATVLMVAPVALAICRRVGVSPVPTIICIAVSSNLQGAATLVGDTTSILLGKAADLDFMDFFFVDGKPGMFFITEAGVFVSALIMIWMFRKEDKVVNVDTKTEVDDKVPTVLLLLTIITLILTSAIPYESNAGPGQLYKPEISNGLICMFYFLIGLAHQAQEDRSAETVVRAISEIDYVTIALLAGLFVIIGGIEKVGIIDMIGNMLAGLSGDGSRASVFIIYTVIVWMSVLFSAFIDNIPYTATMLPVVAVVAEHLSASGGMIVNPNLLYFGLMVGATLGGNLTPIGASANITGMGILRREGYEVSAGEFMRYAVPFTLSAVMTGYIFTWIIWA